MNAPEHFRAAEKHLEHARGASPVDAQWDQRQALVHAQLAQVALAGVQYYGGQEWAKRVEG